MVDSIIFPAIPRKPCASQPCRNGGTCRNAENGFMCLCRGGWKGKTCVERDWKCCSSTGDPHFITWDGALFDYQGVCRYTLARINDDNVRIEVKVSTKRSPNFDNQVSVTDEVYIKVTKSGFNTQSYTLSSFYNVSLSNRK